MKDLEVRIRYADLEVEFKGDPKDVSRKVFEWLNRNIPGFDVAVRLFQDPDYLELSETISEYIKSTNSGDIYLLGKASSLSMHLKILVTLSLMKILHEAGHRDSDASTLDELSKILSSSQKSVSSRLSELRSQGYIEKMRENKHTKYRITVRGLLYIMNKLK